MVLKCLNHIYRLSTDVMFFTWSPFVWMKINWWQMRNSTKRVKDTVWSIAAPSGCFVQLTCPQRQCRGGSGNRLYMGSDTSWGTSEIKIIKISRNLYRIENLGRVTDRGKRQTGFPFFLMVMRESQQTVSINQQPHYHDHHNHDDHQVKEYVFIFNLQKIKYWRVCTGFFSFWVFCRVHEGEKDGDHHVVWHLLWNVEKNYKNI